MFLALRELRHSRLRYLLFGAIIAMIAWLVFLLSGLANGLSTDNAAAIQKMPVDYFVFQADARTQLGRSLLPLSTLETIRQLPGVTDAAPLGHLLLSVKRAAAGDQLDAALLGIEPGSFISPPITSGRGLDPAIENGVFVDQRLADQGVAVGDTLLVQPTGQPLLVLGFTSGQSLTHSPVIYASLPQWRKLRFAAPGSTGGLQDPISTIAIKADPGVADRIGAAVAGVEVASRDTTVSKLPGYSEESGTVLMIQGFLFVIAAFILAVFFYVITLQKIAQIGILKALGARLGFLTRDLLAQVAILTVAGVLVGALLTFAVAAIIPGSVPFALDPLLVLTYGAILLAVALLGTLLSLRQIATVDALIAIGRND